nr:hypothetical protein [Streptomyces sp. STR69]
MTETPAHSPSPGARPANGAGWQTGHCSRSSAVYESLCTLLADHTLTEPGGNILDVTQLGRGRSVSGLVLKRAWELLQWVEQTGSARRESLKKARAEADRMLNDAKKSIDGSYPTGGRFRGAVVATYGLTLPHREASRMVNRFTDRHTAELQEDHIR